MTSTPHPLEPLSDDAESAFDQPIIHGGTHVIDGGTWSWVWEVGGPVEIRDPDGTLVERFPLDGDASTDLGLVNAAIITLIEIDDLSNAIDELIAMVKEYMVKEYT